MNSVCRGPFVASPPAPLRMERGVITKIPLYVIHAFSVSSPFLSRPIGVTSHTTPLSNRRGVGGEASVNSVCQRPSVGSKRWWKSSVKSVWSVREKNVLRERKTSYASHKHANRGNLTYYSLSNRRGVGGEASVNSVCRRPSVGSKRWWKSSVKSVWSVREKKCPS